MTQNFDVFAKRKGQSAIEYLMTYGWMLLVVAIVGGAIFATVQGQCTQSTSGFSTTDVRVSDFGVASGGELAMELRNAAADPITVENISISDGNNEVTYTGTADITVGSTSTVSISDGSLDFQNADGCNDFDVTINYSGTLGDDTTQSITGTLTNSMQIN